MTAGRHRYPVVGELSVLRLMAGLTQVDMAARMGRLLGRDITVDAVRTWESGVRTPHLENLLAYADVLGYELVVLPIGSPDESPETDAEETE